jgi:RecG-like helicase
MQETNDGFVIAEKDLELRGAGDIYMELDNRD